MINRLTEIFGPQHPLDTNPTWTEKAACKGADPELFFPERGDNNSANQAKAICNTCPIKTDCLDYALFHNCIGIWGGTSGHERRTMISKTPKIRNNYQLAPPPSDIEHGTYAGYAKERRRNIQPCDLCRQAHRNYRQQRKRINNEHNQTTTT